MCKYNREDDSDVDEIIQKIKKIKTSKEDKEKQIKEKAIGFLCSSAIRFLPTNKVKGDFSYV